VVDILAVGDGSAVVDILAVGDGSAVVDILAVGDGSAVVDILAVQDIPTGLGRLELGAAERGKVEMDSQTGVVRS
jgi:hypothetical protein